MENVAQQHFLEKPEQRKGKDPFPAKHLNLWGGCVTILHIEIQAVSAFLEGLWQQRSKITATRAFRP